MHSVCWLALCAKRPFTRKPCVSMCSVVDCCKLISLKLIYGQTRINAELGKNKEKYIFYTGKSNLCLSVSCLLIFADNRTEMKIVCKKQFSIALKINYKNYSQYNLDFLVFN